MIERLAVTSGLSILTEDATRGLFKQTLLLFDAIILGDELRKPGQPSVHKAMRPELEWLMEQGLVRLPPELSDLKVPRTREIQAAWKAIAGWNQRFASERQTGDTLADPSTQRAALEARLLNATTAVARLTAAYLRAAELDATLVHQSSRLFGPQVGTEPVTRIVLSNLPIPDDRTPWEAVCEFRADSVSTQRLTALRRWMRSLASEERSAVDIEDEIRYLLDEYTSHMKLHGVKYRRGMVEVLVTTVADIVEHTLRLRFGTAARQLFEIGRQHLKLTEAERLAPGRELAYILHAREAFPSAPVQDA